jgi:integrase
MNLPLRYKDLKGLRKENINYHRNQFVGVQTKTNKEYYLPINKVMWDLIKTAPTNEILDFRAFAFRWKRAIRRAGLKGLQFRDLRRTAATALHDSGIPLKTISVMLGHSDVRTTIRYLAIKNENLNQAGAILESKYQPPTDHVSLSIENLR